MKMLFADSRIKYGPDFISSAGVTPSAFDLLEPADGLFLAGH